MLSPRAFLPFVLEAHSAVHIHPYQRRSASPSSHSTMADFTDYISFYMDSSAPKYDPQPTAYPPPGSGGPSPTYMASNADSQSHSQGDFYSGDVSYGPNEPAQTSELPEMPLNQSNQQRPPSPARRSLFDFVSPFDALTSPPQQAKRKPVPQQSTGTTDDSSWPNVNMDPKRKSVENLMDQITRGPLPPPAQSVTAQFDPYAPSEELPTPQTEQAQTRASRPLPPQPTQSSSSPRASPPKVAAQARQQRQSVESPIGPLAPQGSYTQQGQRKEKDFSPYRAMAAEARNKNAGGKGKNTSRYVFMRLGYLRVSHRFVVQRANNRLRCLATSGRDSCTTRRGQVDCYCFGKG